MSVCLSTFPFSPAPLPRICFSPACLNFLQQILLFSAERREKQSTEKSERGKTMKHLGKGRRTGRIRTSFGRREKREGYRDKRAERKQRAERNMLPFRPPPSQFFGTSSLFPSPCSFFVGWGREFATPSFLSAGQRGLRPCPPTSHLSSCLTLVVNNISNASNTNVIYDLALCGPFLSTFFSLKIAAEKLCIISPVQLPFWLFFSFSSPKKQQLVDWKETQ